MQRLDGDNLTLSQFSTRREEVELTHDDSERVLGGLKKTSHDPPPK